MIYIQYPQLPPTIICPFRELYESKEHFVFDKKYEFLNKFIPCCAVIDQCTDNRQFYFDFYDSLYGANKFNGHIGDNTAQPQLTVINFIKKIKIKKKK